MSGKRYLTRDWYNEQCDCPLKAAKLTDHEYSNELAEVFDKQATDELGLTGGISIITEEEAKSVWSNTVDHLESMAENSETESEKNRYKAMLELAEMVKKELGWA